MVKSKWGLALAAVVTVLSSLLMSVGLCTLFGLTPTLNGGYVPALPGGAWGMLWEQLLRAPRLGNKSCDILDTLLGRITSSCFPGVQGMRSSAGQSSWRFLIAEQLALCA